MKQQDPSRVIREKILRILSHFPKVSPSMLQISLGSGIPKALWEPVLEELITEGELYRTQKATQGPSGRYQTITTISVEPEGDE